MSQPATGQVVAVAAATLLLLGAPRPGSPAAAPADPFRPLTEQDVHDYIAYTPAVLAELRRSLAAPPPRCLPTDRLETAGRADAYPGAYAEISFLVWAAFEAVVADRSGDPERQSRFVAVPAGDRTLVADHFDEIGALVSALERALADLRCQQARSGALPRPGALSRPVA